MPFRRKSYRKKRYYGRRKGKTMIKRYLRKKSKIGLNFYKLRGTITMQSDFGGTISYRVNMTNPTDCFLDSQTLQDWPNVAGLYDQYRVFAISLKFIPTCPNDTSTITGFHPLYIVPDYDDTDPLPSTGVAIQYERMVVKNMYRPWKLYYKIPKMTNLTSSSTIVSFGFMDVNAPQTNGSIKMYGNSFDNTTPYGTLIGTWYIGAKGRR